MTKNKTIKINDVLNTILFDASLDASIAQESYIINNYDKSQLFLQRTKLLIDTLHAIKIIDIDEWDNMQRLASKIVFSDEEITMFEIKNKLLECIK